MRTSIRYVIAGGTSVTLRGLGFISSTSVTIGGLACTDVSVTSANKLSCTTPAQTAGVKDVVVKSPGSAPATLIGGFTFL